MRLKTAIALLAVVALASSSAALAQEGPKFTIGGTTYFKWLWGNQRDGGALYSFTNVPGEGYGDNGQGTEIELLLDAKVSRYVEVKARLHSRFNQNEWTNFGGFGGNGKPGGDSSCIGGACGEQDPRSNQYVKLRGASIILTPGYGWIDSAVLGANDFGQFDPFTIGKIRYIDRDNGAGLLFQGSALNRQLRWDAVRISLPRLWAGPNYSTGNYTAADAAYGAQAKYTISPQFDLGGIFEWVNDIEVEGTDCAPTQSGLFGGYCDRNIDNGRSTRTRFRNTVVAGKVGFHPSSKIDVRAAYYHSTSESANDLAPANFFGLSGFSPVPAGAHKDWSGKVNVDLNDPFGVGLNFNLEGFRIGGEYVSMMAARRESDVLLTEGHDSAFALPGPSNATFGVFSGNPTVIGYGGWSGPTHQVATINVDNAFTDFSEPIAETVIGWQGFTLVPTWSRGALDLSGEYSYISYNTNWQAFGDNTQPVTSTVYPVTELDTGVGHNFRSAYAPFQDKKTHIAALKAKYVVDIGKGLEIYAKFKYIKETDNRLNDALYLPYTAGSCLPDGGGCADKKNFYFGTNTTADIYGNPPVITVTNPVTGAKATGYQWKPFDSISDDDRDLKYTMVSLGAGYQLTNDLYGLLSYNYYNADLKDGNTAMQAYNLHEMASGKHKKNSIDLKLRYTLGGLSECSLEYQYNFGTFDPDFGGGFVTQYATDQISKDHNVPVNSAGFAGRFGGWNSLEKRTFDQQRLIASMKIGF